MDSESRILKLAEGLDVLTRTATRTGLARSSCNRPSRSTWHIAASSCVPDTRLPASLESLGDLDVEEVVHRRCRLKFTARR